jgi:hypothetical protein
MTEISNAHEFNSLLSCSPRKLAKLFNAIGRLKEETRMPTLSLAALSALCLLAAGCVVSIPSAPGAEDVVLTHKEDDVASCTVLGNVVGLTESNYVRDERREMQNQAVGLGADTVLLTKDRDPPKGTAYRCKPSAAAEATH